VAVDRKTPHADRHVPFVRSRMGVNASNFEPTELGEVRVRLLDGAMTWKFLT
jgi:hypothetical protein